MQAKKTQVYLQPAASVIAKFGGARRLSELLGLDKSTVCQWRVPKARGGTGGLIPARHHAGLMDLGREVGVKIRPADLVKRVPVKAVKYEASADAR